MPRSLAAGHTKFVILTTAPADPANPLATELNAGIDASDFVLDSDFAFSAADSDKVQEKSLASDSNANAIAAGNYTAGFTVFRYYDAATGDVDTLADAVFQACKVKGTELWCYARRTGKGAAAAFAAGDELFLGAHVLTDTPQPPSDLGGYIKNRIPCEVQDAWDFVDVA